MRFLSSPVKWVVHEIGNLLRSLHIAYLRCTGVQIGRNCMISLRAKIDARRGAILIGHHCTITYGCVLLSHDRSAMHIDHNDNGEGHLIIGNNVYIGVNSVILRNVTIGDNSVIGAGSIVTKDIPESVVAVGNPCRVIKKIELNERSL